MSNDLKQLQGTWSITSLETDGAPIGRAMLGDATISVTEDRFTTAGMGVEYAGHLELNEENNPKTLAMHFESGPEAGNTNHGIYEVDGDHWQLCLCMTGGPAPAAFKTASGSGHALETLVRVPL